ncbi:MAG TPA: aryl-sulfate sulfotransferase, partial [Polyangiaceae bacterium]
EYRTLLLGMKPSTQYYARITAKNGASTYTSEVLPLMTGFLPNGLPTLEVNDSNAAGLWEGGGFTVQCTGLATGGFPGGGGGPDDSYAFVFDKDGDQVWAYELTDTSVAGCSRARMSVDGKSMWAGNFNNADSNGYVMRISMDGLETEDIMIQARNHDFAFLPNGDLLYWEQQNGGGYTDGKEGPDIIRSMNPATRVVTDIYDQLEDFSEQIEDSQGSHTNQINYVPELDAISFSMRHTSTVGLISYPAGELMTVFGGPITSYSNMDWDFQHGHHVLADRVFIFNNNGSNGGSSILGFQFDMAASTATPTLDYSSGKSSGAFGDVKELANGNLYVTYSTSGVIHEVSASGTLLREITTSASLGYSEHRKTLYGPPPPFDAE